MRKRILGAAFIMLPWLLLPMVIGGYAFSSFAISMQGGSGNVGSIELALNFLLGLAGVVAVLGIIVGVPVGIFLITRKDADWITSLKKRPRFQDLSETELRVVTKWSWVAFFNPMIWALGNKQWLWFLGTFIPFFDLYPWIKLSAEGNAIAWERSTETVPQFQKRQRIIAWVIVAVVIVSILGSMAQAYRTATSVRSSATSSQDHLCARATDTDGDGIWDTYERILKTDPTLADTDGDGYADADELTGGYDPTGPGVASDSKKAIWISAQKTMAKCP